MATAPKRPQVVIVGGGFGGINAARALEDADVDVTVIDRRRLLVDAPAPTCSVLTGIDVDAGFDIIVEAAGSF